MNPNPATRLRSLFIGHGAPTLALSAHPATHALRELGRSLPAPSAAIVISPHRQSARFEAGNAERFAAWHDFSGFPRALYDLRYDVPGDPALAERVVQVLRTAGLDSAPSHDARIDHGIWVPLRLMWPQANVPLVPLSPSHADPAAHHALGQALRPLTDDNVLVIGSGSITHNLYDVDFGNEFAPVAAWAQEFDDWIAANLSDPDALVRYRTRAPHARHAHPTDEHLLPLFVAAGAGGAASPVFRGFCHGSVSLSAWAFQ